MNWGGGGRGRGSLVSQPNVPARCLSKMSQTNVSAWCLSPVSQPRVPARCLNPVSRHTGTRKLWRNTRRAAFPVGPFESRDVLCRSQMSTATRQGQHQLTLSVLVNGLSFTSSAGRRSGSPAPRENSTFCGQTRHLCAMEADVWSSSDSCAAAPCCPG